MLLAFLPQTLEAFQGSPKTPRRVGGLLFVARPGARLGQSRELCVQHGGRAAARANSTASVVFCRSLFEVHSRQNRRKA